mmetsp:Transcript_28320/g.56991  ORF Transcript_28320/g.56991 Transcript_28320/m.56991 type:complete len:87 (+) Transcript_28320:1203-1463(+)
MPTTNPPIPNLITTPHRTTNLHLLPRPMLGTHSAHLGIIGAIGSRAAFDGRAMFDAEGVVDYLVGAAGGVSADCSLSFLSWGGCGG